MGAQLINVAGHRVTTDPLAIPFSMGRNLFCIYSKKYMEDPPEQKPEKQKHNVRTLKTMADMLVSGALEGGREGGSQEGKKESKKEVC
jgi:glycerol-3-phosphate O-acyltransferase